VTPFFKDKEGVFFKVASFDALMILVRIHSILCCLSQAQEIPRESNFLILAFYDACQITGHY
jgi:hypothetical protein